MKNILLILVCFLPLFAVAQSTTKTTTNTPTAQVSNDTLVNRSMCYLLLETNPPMGKTHWAEGMLITITAQNKAIGQVVLIKNKKEKNPDKQYREVKQNEIVHAISPIQYIK
jgi:hypothetical protein